jgi:hypothetical protein
MMIRDGLGGSIECEARSRELQVDRWCLSEQTKLLPGPRKAGRSDWSSSGGGSQESQRGELGAVSPEGG